MAEHELTITATMLDVELVPTEALQHWKYHWLSTVRTSRAVSLEGRLVLIARETESNPIEVDRMPEARVRDVDIDH